MTIETNETNLYINNKIDLIVENINSFASFNHHDNQSVKTVNRHSFIDSYLSQSNITDDEYRYQRAVTAFYWIREHYLTNLMTDSRDDKERFIAALRTRLTYDFNHPDPLAPTLLRSILERFADIIYHNPITVYGALSAIVTAAAAIAVVSFTAALIVGFGTFLSPVFFLSAGIAAISLAIIALTTALLISQYNMDIAFNTIADDNKLVRKYSGISIDGSHVQNAKRDVHLRPWEGLGLFSSGKITQNNEEHSPEASHNY